MKETDRVFGLNEQAWNKWVAYKKQLHKKFVPASMEAAQKKLAAFGEYQMQVVDQSIERGWSGLFELPKSQVKRLDAQTKKVGDDRRKLESWAARALAVGFRAPHLGEDPITYEMLVRRAEDADYWRRRNASVQMGVKA